MCQLPAKVQDFMNGAEVHPAKLTGHKNMEGERGLPNLSTGKKAVYDMIGEECIVWKLRMEDTKRPLKLGVFADFKQGYSRIDGNYAINLFCAHGLPSWLVRLIALSLTRRQLMQTVGGHMD